MTFDDFMTLALSVDPSAMVDEDEDGFLRIHTNYHVVGDETVPLGYTHWSQR